MAIPFYKTSTFTGLVSTKNYGTSENWNSVYTTVKSNSAGWIPGAGGTWGTITGILSTQTDLWSYLSAGGTSNFDIATLNNYLSTTPILLSSLNVNGVILSAGTNLFDIFLTSETDAQTLSYIASSYLLSISNGNTINLSSINSTFAAVSGKYESVYSVVTNASAKWNEAYNTATVYQTNSSSYATTAYTESTYLPLSGGTLTNNLSVYGSTFINNNLTVGGNLTAIGTATFANTIFTTTSALSVYNTGPGPALYVYQASGPYDVASFYDGDGIEVLHVGNAGPGGFGKVGVNESFPNEELTVRGSISATESIFATSILSGGVDLKDIFLTSETDSQTLSYTESSAELSISSGNTISLSSLQPQLRQFDYIVQDSISYNYCGTAPQGSLTSDSTWTIKRILFTSAGTLLSSGTVNNSIWNNRYSYSY